jgi:hypothetical protein
MDDGHENDYDRLAAGIGEAIAIFTGNSHAAALHNSDSITMTKDGFIRGVIELQRLRDWAEGLADVHRAI